MMLTDSSRGAWHAYYTDESSPASVQFKERGSAVPIASRIAALANLESGWYFGAGDPPSQTNIDAAASLGHYLSLLGLKQFSVFPGEKGEVQIIGERDGYTVEVTVEVNGSVTLVVEEKEEEIFYGERLTTIEAKRTVAEFVGAPWRYFDLYTLNTTTQNMADLRLLPFRIQVALTEGSPLFVKSVSRKKEMESANIFEYSIRSKQGSLLSSGGFLPGFMSEKA